jgi:hypothetical protein
MCTKPITGIAVCCARAASGHANAVLDLGKTQIGKAFGGIPYFEEWNLKTLNDRQGMFRDLALKAWGLQQMPDFSSVL